MKAGRAYDFNFSEREECGFIYSVSMEWGSNGRLSPLPAIPSTRSFLCHCCPWSSCGAHTFTLTFPFSSILMCCWDLASTSVQLFMTPLPSSWPPSHTDLRLSLLLFLVSLSSSRWYSPLLSSCPFGPRFFLGQHACPAPIH